MITFKHITQIKECPHCKTKRVDYAKYDGVHTCGEQFETIRFDCGYSVTYSPNFSKFEYKELCRHSKQAKEQSEEMSEIKREITELLLRRYNKLNSNSINFSLDSLIRDFIRTKNRM